MDTEGQAERKVLHSIISRSDEHWKFYKGLFRKSCVSLKPLGCFPMQHQDRKQGTSQTRYPGFAGKLELFEVSESDSSKSKKKTTVTKEMKMWLKEKIDCSKRPRAAVSPQCNIIFKVHTYLMFSIKTPQVMPSFQNIKLRYMIDMLYKMYQNMHNSFPSCAQIDRFSGIYSIQ